MGLSVADVVSEFGAYYINEGQGLADLLTLIKAKTETDMIFVNQPTENTRLRKAYLETERVLQAFQKAFTPIGTHSFKPRQFDLAWLKIDQSFYPDDVVESWLGFLDDNKVSRKDKPLVAYMIEQFVRQANDDWERHEAFWGVKGSVTPGTATSQGASADGIRKLINDGINASEITPITMGAVPTDPVDMVDYMEQMWLGLSDEIRSQLDSFFMSRTLRDRFKTGMRKKYNMMYNQAGDLLTIIDTDMKVTGLLSHAGSDKIWATPRINRSMGLKKPGAEKLFDVQGFERVVKCMSDWWKGYALWIPQYIITNDQDLDD